MPRPHHSAAAYGSDKIAPTLTPCMEVMAMLCNRRGMHRFLALLMTALMGLGMCGFGCADAAPEDVELVEFVTECAAALPDEAQEDARAYAAHEVEAL